MSTAVHLVSLGCARNDVDSEELAARLDAEGFELTADPEQAEIIMVNTCGFIEQAKKDSIDTILAAADHKQAGTAKAVVAVGCLAQRYGQELAEALPEADAVLGFDAYPQIAERLRTIMAGGQVGTHHPHDRRTLLPLTPIERPAAANQIGFSVPGHDESWVNHAPASGPRLLRHRLQGGPFAPLKIASGCDRRCAFCAIPSFRGAYLSRPVAEVVAEAQWLVEQGVKEIMLVSENSSSYGKDLPGRPGMGSLLSELSQVDGLAWIRVSYLQPAEITPQMLTAIAATPKVVPYFDLSFQHASASVLRRMRRFGDGDNFLALIEQVRALAPQAGIRSNFITGFPGETPDDLRQLTDFLQAARLDAAGVFAYSDEEGTEGVGLADKVAPEVIEARQAQVTELIDELCNQRAADRVGEQVQVLIESVADGQPVGRAAHQGPEVDGTTTVIGASGVVVGDLLTGRVSASTGVDLLVKPS